MTENKKSTGLTGKHVLLALLLFFGVIFTTNGIMMTLALKTFPGEDQKKSYMQGLHYNQTLSEREAQAALGWHFVLQDGAELPAGATQIILQIMDDSGNAVRGLDLSLRIFRPATDREDQILTMEETSPGHYKITADELAAGSWQMEVIGTAPSGEKLVVRKRLWLK
jgi:nitrogen fixation protein FixH